MSTSVPSTPRAHLPLLSSNDPPSFQEACIVRGKIEQLEGQQEQLLQEIAPIQAKLDDTIAEIESLKPIVSPVRRLPLEILGEIFLRVPTSQLRPRNYQKHVVRVSQVCKSWRDAARLTPRLWCDIWVKADAPGLTYESLLAWTSRGGSMPKISSSRCGRLDRCSGRNICARRRCLFSNIALAKFLKFSPAGWDTVVLNCPTPNCLRNFTKSLNRLESPVALGGWNTVRSFEVNMANWTGWIDPLQYQIFTFVPSSVTGFSLHLPWIPDSADLGGSGDDEYESEDSQWQWCLHIPHSLLRGLTSIELKFDAPTIYAEPLFTALHHCSRLETLQIDFYDGFFVGEGDTPITYITFPELRRLRLLQVPGECAGKLGTLKFPKLLDMSMSFGIDSHVDWYDERPCFSLRADTHGMWFDGDSLAEFICGDGSSPSTIQGLHLKGASFLPGTIHRVLRDLRSLSHLKLEWAALLGDVWSDPKDFFYLMEDQPASLTSLKTLEVTNLVQPVDSPIPFLEDFIGRRGIDLKLSLHDREAWKRDGNRYLYLAGLGPDSEGED